jgi:hypothetical protein
VIQHIESGRRGEDNRRRRDITVDELLAIADGLEMSVRDLLPEASLMSHRSERERTVRMATRAIEEDRVRLAALQEVEQDLQARIHNDSQELEIMRTRVNGVMHSITRQQQIIAAYDLPDGEHRAD